jgi:hypothetical protein
MSFNDRDWYRDELKKKTNKQRTALTNNAKTNLANRPSEPSKNSLLKTLLTASLLIYCMDLASWPDIGEN